MAKLISGLDKLNRSLARIPPNVTAALRKAMEQSAEEIAELARTLAPTGDTGELKNSIGWTWSEKPPKGTLAIGSVGARGGPDDLRIIIYAGDDQVFYARQVEFGTQAHVITSKRGKTLANAKTGQVFGSSVNHPGSVAQPFFLPAYRNLRKRVRTRISRSLGKAIRQGISK